MRSSAALAFFCHNIFFCHIVVCYTFILWPAFAFFLLTHTCYIPRFSQTSPSPHAHLFALRPLPSRPIPGVYKTSLSRHRASAPPHLVPQAACPSTLVIPSASAYPDHHVLRLAHFLIRGCLKPSLVASLGFTGLLIMGLGSLFRFRVFWTATRAIVCPTFTSVRIINGRYLLVALPSVSPCHTSPTPLHHLPSDCRIDQGNMFQQNLALCEIFKFRSNGPSWFMGQHFAWRYEA
jgi:hypothetical protein